MRCSLRATSSTASWVVLLAAIGTTSYAITRKASGDTDAQSSAEADIKSDSFLLDLSGAARGALKRSAKIAYRGSASALLVRLAVYHGVLDEDRIAALIEAGKAETLEWRLRQQAHDALTSHLTEVENNLREVTVSMLAAS